MRIVKGFAALLLVLLLALGGVIGWYVFAVSPKTSGSVTLKGLTAAVEIVRDENGVPHIYARSVADAQFALGFAHAQDRLWQMETHRRIANGRLAEVLGAPGLEPDRFLRTLGIRRSAEAIYKNVPEADRVLIDAYASGVNAYLSSRTGPLPPEFQILQAPSPEAWTGPDTVGWIIMMAFDLGSNWSTELFRLRLVQAGWSTDKIDQFLPNYLNRPYPAHADYAALYKDILAPAPAKMAEGLVPPAPIEGVGSNNWVVAGSHSMSGKPLLANDPHLGLSAPALWYFAHLSAPGLNVIGATLPGVPGVILGRNDRIAWAFTNTNPDVQDMFIEKLTADGKGFETPDGPKPFDTVQEVIKVKGQADVTLNVRISRHGPIISDGAEESASKLVKDGYAIAFQWTALRTDNTSVSAAFGINTAKNLAEFKTAASRFTAPEQNILYADVDGNIAYFAPAQVPVRKKDNDLSGMAPALGWQAKYDWDGFLTMDQVPQNTNPERGYHYTANEKVVSDDYPHFITNDWTIPHRANRIKALLEATPKHDAASFQSLHGDTVSLAMLKVLPILTKTPGASDEEKAILSQLRAFDGNMATSKPEPLIAAAWMREFTRLVITDDLGPMFPRGFDQNRQTFIEAVLSGAPYAEDWCDDKRTAKKESCADQIATSLTLALADLKSRYGNDRSRWQWGEAHKARSAHRPFSRVAPLRPLFDIMVPVPGDAFTVNVARYTMSKEDEPYTSTHGPSLRAIYDLADPEKSQFIHSTGQSGLFFSSLYSNLNPLWADVKYIPMQMKRESIEKGALGTLKLEPGP